MQGYDSGKKGGIGVSPVIILGLFLDVISKPKMWEGPSGPTKLRNTSVKGADYVWKSPGEEEKQRQSCRFCRAISICLA